MDTGTHRAPLSVSVRTFHGHHEISPTLDSTSSSMSIASIDFDDHVHGHHSGSSPSPSSIGFSSGVSFYRFLNVQPDASPSAIKHAYLRLLRLCHPDLRRVNGLSDDEERELNSMMVTLNSIYAVLSDPEARASYDAVHGITIPLDQPNPFTHGPSSTDPADAVFVDENACIGCVMCVAIAPETFAMEPLNGRARVVAQGASPLALVDEAIAACPVNCIHKLSREVATLLEQEVMATEASRPPVHVVRTVPTPQGPDLWTRASATWKRKRAEAVQRIYAQSQTASTGVSSGFAFDDFVRGAVRKFASAYFDPQLGDFEQPQSSQSTRQGSLRTGAATEFRHVQASHVRYKALRKMQKRAERARRKCTQRVRRPGEVLLLPAVATLACRATVPGSQRTVQ